VTPSRRFVFKQKSMGTFRYVKSTVQAKSEVSASFNTGTGCLRELKRLSRLPFRKEWGLRPVFMNDTFALSIT